MGEGSGPRPKTVHLLDKLAKGERVALASRRTAYMDDYATDGWMAMATGGIECYPPFNASKKPPQKDGAPAPLPEYLSAAKTAQLFELPVRFGQSKASEVSSDRATIDYEIQKTGPNSKAVLYYGPVDC